MTDLYGPPKKLTEISLADMQKNPIWLWCLNLHLPDDEADGPLGGDETSMRPWLGDSNVTPDMGQPHILLKVEGTELWAAAFFDRAESKLDALAIYGSDGWRSPDTYLENPGQQITYVAVPSIEGKLGLKFTAKNRRRTVAFLEGYAPAIEAASPADGTVASLLQTNPELLELLVAFFCNAGKDLLAKGYSVIVPWVSGGLEDESPALYAQLIEKSKGAGLAVTAVSSQALKDEETARHCVVLVVTDIKKDADSGYVVRGYWLDKTESMQEVSLRLVVEGGQWRSP